MARLPRMAPRLTAARPVLAAPKDEAGRSQFRRDTKGHNLYDSRRWRGSDAKGGRDGLRYQVLLDALFTCAMCGRMREPSGLVADHKTPHKGDETLFFDRENLQCVCKPCHDSAKAKLERQQGFR